MGHLELIPVALQPAAHHPNFTFRQDFTKVILPAVEKDESEETRFIPATYSVWEAPAGGWRMFVDSDCQCRYRSFSRI